MDIQKVLAATVLALGIGAVPVLAGDITWSLNGSGLAGGILFADGTEIDGTVTYDTISHLFVSNTISSVSDTGGVGQIIPTEVVGGWFFDQNACCNGDPNNVSGQAEILMTTSNDQSALMNAQFFSLVPVNNLFDLSDSPGEGIAPYVFNEQLFDDNNPLGNGAATYAGTCDASASDCSVLAANDPSTPIVDNQGNPTEFALANCPTCDSSNPSAWLSTVVPAAPTGGGPGPTPEPSTFVMLGSGLVLAGLGRRKFFTSKK